MLNITKNGEVVLQVNEGGAVNLDGFHASPVKAGWEFELDGNIYTAVEAPPPPEPTPEEIRAGMPPLSRRQILLALDSIGISEADVDALLAGDTVGMIEWKNAGSYHRLHPLIVDLSNDFELSAEQVDTLWMWASEL